MWTTGTAASRGIARPLWIAGALAAILVLAAHLRISGISEWHFSGDDLWNVELASEPGLGAVTDGVRRHYAHPFLYYWVLHGTLAATPHVLAPRWPALSFGFAAVLAFFVLGRVAARSDTAGLWMAFAAAVSPVLVIQSQTVRQYTMLVTALALMLAAWIAAARRPRVWLAVAYLAAGLVAVLSQYSAVIVMLPAGLIALARRRGGAALRLDRERAVWLCAHLFLAAAFAWEAIWTLRSFGLAGDLPYLSERMIEGPRDLVRSLWYLRLLVIPKGSPAPVLLYLGFLASLAIAWRIRERELVALALGVPALAVLLSVLQAYPLTGGRWSSYLLPILLLPGAVAIPWLASLARRRAARLALPALPFALLLVNFFGEGGSILDPDSYRRADFDFAHRFADHDRALRHLTERVQPGDSVLVSPATAARLEYDRSTRGSELAARLLDIGSIVDLGGYEFDERGVEELLRRFAASDSRAAQLPGSVWLLGLRCLRVPAPCAEQLDVPLDPSRDALDPLALPLDWRTLQVSGATSSHREGDD